VCVISELVIIIKGNISPLKNSLLNRFREWKEERNKISKALPDEQLETLVSTSKSDSSLDDEAKGMVSIGISFVCPYHPNLSIM